MTRAESLEAFARRLLDPEDLGWAVTNEVRAAARKALETVAPRPPRPATRCGCGREENPCPLCDAGPIDVASRVFRRVRR